MQDRRRYGTGCNISQSPSLVNILQICYYLKSLILMLSGSILKQNRATSFPALINAGRWP